MGHRAFLRDRLRVLVVGVGVLVLSVVARADLAGDVRKVLNDKLLAKADVGVVVVSLSDGKRIYEHGADKPRIPASNMKVLTTAAAIDVLGADFRYRTMLVKRGDDLVLLGDGDPMFGDAKVLRKAGWDITTVYKNWAEQLKRAGMTSFEDVYVDDSVFDGEMVHPKWPKNQLHFAYSAEVAGMTLNVGCLEVSVQPTRPGELVQYKLNPPTQYVTVQNTCETGGGRWIVDRTMGTNQVRLAGATRAASDPVAVTISDPAMYAATVLAETLRSAGIQVTGKVQRDRTVRGKLEKNDAKEMALLIAHETPLLQVVARTNKDSQNHYAESLCKRIGYATSGQSGSWENGTAGIGSFLLRTGAKADSFDLDDGSGLSRANTVSPATVMCVLLHMWNGKHRDAFLNTLPVGGEDGTLDNRFKGGLGGRVFAKTGYINQVSSLSGYLKAKNGEWYAFSILMNDVPPGTNSRAKELQEDIVEAVDRAAGK